MARNDALASGHTVINAIYLNSLSYFVYVTDKLTVDHMFLELHRASNGSNAKAV